MKDIDITILIVTAVFSLYCSFFSIHKRILYLRNRVFMLLCLVSACMSLIGLYKIYYDSSGSLIFLARLFFIFLLLIIQLLFTTQFITPPWEKKFPVFLTLLSQIPGITVILFIVFTEYIIKDVKYAGSFTVIYGRLYWIYYAVIIFYSIALYLFAVYKSKRLVNELMRIQLPLIAKGYMLGTIMLVILSYILPVFYDKHDFFITGTAIYSFLILLIMNYTISIKRYVDIRRFYLKTAGWLVFMAMLYIPTAFMIDYIKDKKVYVFIAGIVALILLFIILFYIFHPLAGKVINRKDRFLVRAFRIINKNLTQLADKRNEYDWDTVYKQGVDNLCASLGIVKASLFLYDKEEGIYSLSHSYEDNLNISELDEDDRFIECLKFYKEIIHRAFAYSDKSLTPYRDALEQYLFGYGYKIAVPVFSYQGTLISVLFLSGLKRENYNRMDFVLLLDEYNIIFSKIIEFLYNLNEVRKIQAKQRDRIFLKDIKRNITPVTLAAAEGISIDSMIISNTDIGGDYLNAVRINNRTGIFAANIPDIGLESSLLSLEVDTVFRAQCGVWDSPEDFLNIINKVLCSSELTDKYAAALYAVYNPGTRELVYSFAAYNPFSVYDPKRDDFAEYETEGVPVGIDIGYQYKRRSSVVPLNGIGFFYSKGISSAYNNKGEIYSPGRIKDIIRNNSEDSTGEIIKKIYDDISGFIKDNRPVNDISVVVFRMH